jgi:hypothetical protein
MKTKFISYTNMIIPNYINLIFSSVVFGLLLSCGPLQQHNMMPAASSSSSGNNQPNPPQASVCSAAPASSKEVNLIICSLGEGVKVSCQISRSDFEKLRRRNILEKFPAIKEHDGETYLVNFIHNNRQLQDNDPLSTFMDANSNSILLTMRRYFPEAYAPLLEPGPEWNFTSDKTHMLEKLCAYKNPNFIIQVLTKSGWVFKFVSVELRGNRDVVLAAVKQDGEALRYTSHILRNDRAVVLAAVSQNGAALRFASENLIADRGFILESVSQDGRTLQYASPELRVDREVVLAAVKQNGLALQYASPELREDKKVVLAAVSQDGLALQDASPELREDREVLRAAMEVYYILSQKS